MRGSCASAILLGLALVWRADAAEPAPVTRAEFDRLRADNDLLRSEVKQMAERRSNADGEAAPAPRPGSTVFLFSGYAAGTFASRSGETPSFSTAFNPILLWRIDDSLSFAAELEVEREDDLTTVGLEYATIDYRAGDWVVFSAGRFLTPFGLFGPRFHPSWINRLPDAPMIAGHDGLVPISDDGLQASGGLPIGDARVSWAIYLSNGPRLNDGADEPEEVGLLHFDQSGDLNRGKAVGGRLGILPVPGIELGSSIQFARVGAHRSEQADADALLAGVDLSCTWDSRAIRGAFDLKAEYIWSHVDRASYTVTFDPLVGPQTFVYADDDRAGGYVQASYRPSRLRVPVLRDLEAVVRYEVVRPPASPIPELDGAMQFDRHDRWTTGLDWWITPSAVLKGAFERDTATGERAYLAQLAIGF
ncbi:MAG: hypothetical protein H0W83_04520 [Planctomycetes bacterium]|nr:hypothetical protein [Planctomycetota bacterium]